VIFVRVEVCIDMDIYDLMLLFQMARSTKTPIDSLLKKAIAEYIDKLMVSTSTTSSEGGK